MNAVALAHFAAKLPPRRARLVLDAALRCMDEEIDPLAAARRACAEAFEADMHGVGKSIAAALHASSMEALHGLRHLLPGLLREANESSRLALALSRAMLRAAGDVFSSPLESADGGEYFSETPVETEGLRQWRRREVFETDLSSAELRGFSQQLRNRSIFSARTTNAEYLKEVAATVDDILSGKIGMSEGRIRLMRKLKQIGYDPAVGFPGEVGLIPPAERGSLQDLSSAMRIDLVLETNVRMAHGYAQVIAGNSEQMRYNYPAWELIRLYTRTTPRGSAESKSVGWETRWHDAGGSVNWEGAVQEPLIALKDSPIWQALGDGAGGYTDTLLNPFYPFAFRSGKGWKAVPRARAIELGLIRDEALPAATEATLTPGQKEVVRVFESMPEDFRAELERELGL